MKQLILKYSFLPLLVLLTSCWKEPVYPVEPSISFSRISQEVTKDTLNNDVARITVALNFKDGDGDLGLDDEDIKFPPYFDPENVKKASNYFIMPYFKVGKDYVPYPELALVNGYRFPRLEPTDQVQTLEGELRYKFDIFQSLIPFKFPSYKSGDSVRFDIFILDRKFNISNTITTDPIPVYEP